MILDENTNIYVKIDNDDELKLFCDYINKNYPNKFCWYSDSLTPGFQRKRITIEYMKKFLSKFQFTLGINAGFVFGFNTTKLKSGTVVNGRKVVSVYDIVDDNNKPTIPNWLKC